jgi:hypothetical protein
MHCRYRGRRSRSDHARAEVEALDRIDPVERLSHVLAAVTVSGSDHFEWRTPREQEQSPNSYTIGRMSGGERPRAILSPPHRPRASLRLSYAGLAEDLTVVLPAVQIVSSSLSCGAQRTPHCGALEFV